MRPTIEIVIPVQGDSEQLSRAIALIEKHTTNYRLHIVKEPSLNVSEARQKAMDEIVKGDLVCFLDDDSEMIMDGWLDEMFLTLDAKPDAGAVFGGEWWGTQDATPICPVVGDVPISYGPAACMLIDRRRIPAGVMWDTNIGLRSGWLGGDFEEVEYCFNLRHHGLNLYRATKTLFHHTGGRTTLDDWCKTDRQKAIIIMKLLLDYKYAKAPEDRDWFKGLQYVKADPANDCMLAPGSSLRECYREVIRRNGLEKFKRFQRMGLI